jgi:purine nucleosidase
MIRMVIDTDPGVDDAQAIMMASAHPNVKIEAITTVSGNVPLKENTINALKIMEFLNEPAPVFAGCRYALVEQVPNASHIHGADGLGDSGIPTPKRKVESEHAVNALIRLANENPGELTLVAIGPLTNLAMAIRLDPDLPSKYKNLYIMGGAYLGKGNTPITTAEFNIYQDPEAASVVFDTWKDLTMISWEATMDHGIDGPQLDAILNSKTEKGLFHANIAARTIAFIKEYAKQDRIYGADPLAMAVAMEPDIVEEMHHLHVHVERFGRQSRGQTIVDWYGNTDNKPNTNIIVKVNQARFAQLFLDAVS